VEEEEEVDVPDEEPSAPASLKYGTCDKLFIVAEPCITEPFDMSLVASS